MRSRCDGYQSPKAAHISFLILVSPFAKGDYISLRSCYIGLRKREDPLRSWENGLRSGYDALRGQHNGLRKRYNRLRGWNNPLRDGAITLRSQSNTMRTQSVTARFHNKISNVNSPEIIHICQSRTSPILSEENTPDA
ncbi:hypothetical protein [Carboxylicivirga taeanensis]|uniref:hypothetical protein n=1 Tax=Carboxylicivirga taeanensis TaxID=1416875 RepID=UPI003F6DEEAD